jgi:hypothetical protein
LLAWSNKYFFGGFFMGRTNGLTRRVLSFIAVSLVLLLPACSHGRSDAVWLEGLQNPFIGKWEADIPSAQMHLVFDYKTDGAFDYEIPGLPVEQGGKGSGGYLVAGNVMVSYLAFEGAAGYVFKVRDNDTIDVTEIENVKGDGSFVLGNTTPFTRVAGSSVNKENKPFVLNHSYLGVWRFEADMDGHHYLMEYKMNVDESYDVTQGVDGQVSSYSANYFVYDHKLIVYIDGEGFSEAVITDGVDSNHITVSDGAETGFLTRTPNPPAGFTSATQ